jgi:hypothetical protein
MHKIQFWEEFLIRIKWSPWNPWSLGRMNLAWCKYTQTVMYEERKKLEGELPENFENFAYRAFVDNCEMQHFVRYFTFWDKVRLFLTPFSFGTTFQMPLYELRHIVFGSADKTEE